MKRRFDNLYLGLGVGVLIPIIALFLYYLYDFRFMPISNFLEWTRRNDMFTPYMKRCVIANLAPFFFFIYTERMQSGRGVLFSMFIWAAFIGYLTYLA